MGTYPGRKVKTAEITAPRSPATAEQFVDGIREQLKYTQNVITEQAIPADVYVAASKAVRNHLTDSWFKTQAGTVNGNTKAVGYLSAEFLIGKQLHSALLSTGLAEQFDKAMKALGFKVQDVVNAEYEPGLGNGGLGHLAACFIDSLASLGVSAFDYGIQYKHSIFKQKPDRDGKQVEAPDYWLANEKPWGHAGYNHNQEVSFGGKVVENVDGTEAQQPVWSVYAVPMDYLVSDYKSGHVNTLRLWSARSYDKFDLLVFNRSEHTEVVTPQVKAEDISKILYPEDSTRADKGLRFEQQYFFVSAPLHDAIRVLYLGQDKSDLTTFPNKVVFQLSDTHPVIGIPELVRTLTDEYNYDWDTARLIITKTFDYTCHTLLPEALEVWPTSPIGELLPCRLGIIEKINAQFEDEPRSKGIDKSTIKNMVIYTNDAVRMVHLVTYGGFRVSDVTELYSRLLEDIALKSSLNVYPDKFTSVTNGVTPRRSIKLVNPRLPDLITEGFGTDKWLSDPEMLRGLRPPAKDDELVKKFATTKKASKVDFTAYAKREYGLELDSDTMFNVMTKRLHEYKRQSLKILSVIPIYTDIKPGKIKAEDITPCAMLFGTKAIPDYYLTRMTIQLTNNVFRVVNNDPDVKDKLAVYSPWSYNVCLAWYLTSATDLNEQVLQTDREASGIGSMKFALNGAMIASTLDGVNAKIRGRVGTENSFLFGMTVDEVEKRHAEGYNPASYYETDPRLKHAIDTVANGTFSNGDRNVYSLFVADWLTKDWFITLADFSAYVNIRSEIEAPYVDGFEWDRKALLNMASSGYFSPDRSMEDYLKCIWHTTFLA